MYRKHSVEAGISILNGVSKAGSWSGELFLIQEIVLCAIRRNHFVFCARGTLSAFSIDGS